MQAAGVTRDDVSWCFQNILGRDIAGTDIGHFVETEQDFRSLVHTLVQSAEFQSRLHPPHGVVVRADGFVYDVTVEAQARAQRILAHLEPQQVAQFTKIRVGNAGDGGYVMLNDFHGIEAAYSLGINDDVTWDRHMADLGIDVYQYDHTISRLPEAHERFHWFKTGIGITKQGIYDTLPNLMQANGHAASTELLLKCDIEGSEWEMLRALSHNQLRQFRQIVLETHGWQMLSERDTILPIEAAIANLAVSHRLVHVHANNHAAYALVGGIPLPAVLELTFVRIDDKAFSASDETFPTPLDQSCRPGTPDYRLGHFRF